MAFQITHNPSVFFNSFSTYQQRNHQSYIFVAICVRNPPVIGEFRSQWASCAGSAFMLWRHHSKHHADNCDPISSFSSRNMALQWRHNGRDSVSNHRPHECLLNRLFRRRSKKTSKLRVTGLCAGNLPGTDEFPAQMASYAENVSIWCRHHGDIWHLHIAWVFKNLENFPLPPLTKLKIN